MIKIIMIIIKNNDNYNDKTKNYIDNNKKNNDIDNNKNDYYNQNDKNVL